MIWRQWSGDPDTEGNHKNLLAKRNRQARHYPRKLATHKIRQVLEYCLSFHAQQRLSQRGLSAHDIDYVLYHAQLYHAANAVIYLLRGKDIPEHDRCAMSRLEGTALITTKTETKISTIWRNRKKAPTIFVASAQPSGTGASQRSATQLG